MASQAQIAEQAARTADSFSGGTVITLRIERDIMDRLRAYIERHQPWPKGARSRLMRAFIGAGVRGLERSENRGRTR